jgi:hypothetical protein
LMRAFAIRRMNWGSWGKLGTRQAMLIV